MQFTISFAASCSAEDQGSAFPPSWFLFFSALFLGRRHLISFSKNTLAQPSENEVTMNSQTDCTLDTF